MTVIRRRTSTLRRKTKEWGYSSHLDIEDDTYLVAFLATWLSGGVFGDSSTSIRSETFWVAFDMALRRRYNLVVPHLAWEYNRLETFKAIESQISQNIRALGPDRRLVGVLFLHAHSSIARQARFHSWMARYTKADAVNPSKLFWYSNQIKWRPYNHPRPI